jgi:hypothetical protein
MFDLASGSAAIRGEPAAPVGGQRVAARAGGAAVRPGEVAGVGDDAPAQRGGDPRQHVGDAGGGAGRGGKVIEGQRAGRPAQRRQVRAPGRGAPLPRVLAQFWAPPNPRRRSVTVGGFSMIWEKRTTVTVSSIVTERP